MQTLGRGGRDADDRAGSAARCRHASLASVAAGAAVCATPLIGASPRRRRASSIISIVRVAPAAGHAERTDFQQPIERCERRPRP